MTDEYLEELLRFTGKLCPRFLEDKYAEEDYDPIINAVYREYLGIVGVTSMRRLNTDQLRHLNRLCRIAKEKAADALTPTTNEPKPTNTTIISQEEINHGN